MWPHSVLERRVLSFAVHQGVANYQWRVNKFTYGSNMLFQERVKKSNMEEPFII